MNHCKSLLKTFKLVVFYRGVLIFLALGCQDDTKKEVIVQKDVIEIQTPDLYYGIDRNKFIVKDLKIKRGDSFGKILEENGIDYPEVYEILQAIKGRVDVRKLTIGKPYTLFF
jgi:hypothetical protein